MLSVLANISIQSTGNKDQPFPKKMYIRSAPYVHQESANWVLNMVLFYAKVLLLVFKFVPPMKDAIQALIFLILMLKFSKLATKLIFCPYYRKFVLMC